MSSTKSSIDNEPLSETHHGVNACFIHHPSNVKNNLISHKLETSQPKKVCMSYIFLHLSANFWLKIQNTHHYRNSVTFLTSGQSPLNGPANSPAVIYSTRKPYGSKQSSFLVIMMIRVMFRAGFCHGSWWFMSWFVVICSDLW